jgi:hypothetical protein
MEATVPKVPFTMPRVAVSSPSSERNFAFIPNINASPAR